MLFVAIVIALALATPPADAKGGYALTAATVQSSGWAEPRQIAIRLPAGYDEMIEVLDAEYLAARDAPIERRSDIALGEQLPFLITLAYDFALSGYGTRTWSGRFDGHRRLFFPSAMVVGNGVWQAGWYEANPLVAEALGAALRGPQSPTAGLPRTARGPHVDRAITATPLVPMMALVVATVLLLFARRPHRLIDRGGD